MGEVTLETTPVQLISDQPGQLPATSLDLLNELALQKSLLVCCTCILDNSYYSAVEIELISHNAGVFIMLGSNSIHNNSNILIGEIGEGDDGALVCVTDLIWCCRNADTPGVGGALGEWFYPNGSAVPVSGRGFDFYRSRGA